MKLKIRTLKQDKYEIEVDPSITVEKLKDIIEQTYKFEKSSQTLIFAGKILPNDVTIESCKIGNEDFLVLMVKKGNTPKPAATTTTPPVTTAAAPVASAPEKPAAQTPTATASADSEVLADKQVAEALVTGPELEKTIEGIVEMGFPRDQVIAALRAGFNNPSRAVEYLMTGFPTDVAAPPPTTTPSQPRPQRTPASQTQQPPAASSASVFDGLRQHPQFSQLCSLAQTGGEEALKQILTYFAQTNRPLLDLIMQNQDEFIRLLNTPIPGAQGGGYQSPPSGAPPPGVVRINITPDDERVINNLVNMGFDRNRVIEAYVLFEKDETMTANYLLNNPDDQGNGDTGSQ